MQNLGSVVLALSVCFLAGRTAALTPIPVNSTDFCAKDGVRPDTPAVPAAGPATTQEPFPTFNCNPMTQAECDNLALLRMDTCVGAKVIDLDLQKGARRELSNLGRNTSLGIQKIPKDRAVTFGISESALTVPEFTQGVDFATLPENMFLSIAVTPIAKQIISFTLYNCQKVTCTSKLASLALSNLQSFTLDGCSEWVHPWLKREDFAASPRLRMVVISRCVPFDLDAFTFTNLPDLQLLALDNQVTSYSKSYSDAGLLHLRNLHCDCKYAWLRDLFTANPGLLGERAAGSVYQVCDAANPALKKEDVFVPVNCKKNLTSNPANYDWKQTAYSINAGDHLRRPEVWVTLGVLVAVLQRFA
ncbi:uncharacterized protein LOC129601715 [Paramacrobiotus metropolitanus]|uniref:uncharacterized protein LOC129601715 n=1 Tax=Paramacrobiotus metropolitanus TaxID=2943436 RepID=UPI0024455E8B|nr:uncharacterized protein LOC129601715 [Paramacrobiotus metropolitanus]